MATRPGSRARRLQLVRRLPRPGRQQLGAAGGARGLIENRSVPRATVIPELGYSDVLEAADWLCSAFGFRVRLRIADHRAQLELGDGAIVVKQGGGGGCTVLVRVQNADAHHARAEAAGARVLNPPSDYPYGERQYTVEDLGGDPWTFSQSLADVDPVAWGGELVAR